MLLIHSPVRASVDLHIGPRTQPVRSIVQNIGSIGASGNVELAEAFGKLTMAVLMEQRLNTENQREALRALAELSNEAAKTPKKRQGSATINALIMTVTAALSLSADSAQTWSEWGKQLSDFFGF